MNCRITDELNQEELRAERADREWIALCPAMRDTATEIAAGIMRDGRRHRLYLSAFEDGWLNISDQSEAQLVRCLAVFRGHIEADDLTKSQIRPIAEAALNAAIRSLYGSNENISSLCADNFSEAEFISSLVNKEK